MKIRELASKKNLQLAWRRITTGGNNQYKRYFRHLYYAYEVSLDDNLEDLRHRLIGGTFKPQQAERIYQPKNSGLHRPLSLLHIEDQIVLQAFANLAARRLYEKRAPLQFRIIFSNILQSESSIFFFRRWQETYAAFQRKIEKHYKAGLRWVADFDLAAFYDTVSHELLIKTIYPRTPANDDIQWLIECLRTWSSGKATSSHGHGLPQGPLASDFLAECFLLPIDLTLQRYDGYTRYVDDVRLFGLTEAEVRSVVIQLERSCRERGLIPQSGKFAIKRAQSLQDAMGMLPSIADPQRTASSNVIPRDRARKLFASAIEGKPYRVTDKTRFRYVLFRAEADSKLLNPVLRLIPHHPEHVDAFFSYIGLFKSRKPIIRLCYDLVQHNPYPYVRGEAWHLLTGYLDTSKTLTASALRDLTKKAIEIAKGHKYDYFMEKWGACHFLIASEKNSGARLSRFVKYQTPLLQALLGPVLPDSAFHPGETAQNFLQRSAFEPGLSICGKLHGLGISPNIFGFTDSQLHSQVRNTLCQLGILQSRGLPIDPIAEILHARYGVIPTKSWHNLLNTEYVHALGLLKQAEAAFLSGRSFWLATQNSFNHAIFLALQKQLNTAGHPAACKVIGRNGQLVDFGTMLAQSGVFLKTVFSDRQLLQRNE